MANYDNGVTLRELDPISTLTGEEQIFVDYEKAYKLTQDTVIIEGKTYYTYDPDIGIYTAVANPSIESITTYYEAVEAKRYALSRVTLDVQNEIDRIHYYGDKDIIPSDESYFTVNETGETITGLTDAGKTQTELVIPYEINRVKIKLIGDHAFENNTVVQKIVVPSTISIYGGWAFLGCSSLIEVVVNNNVHLNDYAVFCDCTKLEQINFNKPNCYFYPTLTGAMSGCSSLKHIEIAPDCNTIADNSFLNCTSLTSINIPSSTHIQGGAFDGCTNLKIYCEQGSYAETYAKTNNIPVKYTEVELKDLAPRTMVTNLNKTTNKNITKLQKYLDVGGNPSVAYSNFTLSDNGSTITGFSSSASGVVTIPYEINDKSVSLADGAFKDATASVQGLIFPDGGGDIPPSLCENMSTLAYLHLPKYSNGTPESIIYIWDNAFKNCTSLLYVEAHSKVSIWDSAFEGCTALETLDLSCGCDYIGANAFKGCTHLKNLILPRDLLDKCIDPTAFDGCTNLSICCEEGSNAEAFAIANDIPVRYTEISDNTLKGFVTDDVIENRNQYLNFTNSVFPPEESAYTFSDDNTTITGVTTTPVTLTLPYKHNNVDVTTIGASAFKGNTSVVDVTIPKNIATIDSEAFSGCTGVYSVRVCGNITLGSQAFYGCTNLHTITCEGNITLGSNAFEGTSLTSIDLTNIAGVSIGANVFKDCTNLKQVIIPSKVKIINAAAFSGCTNLTIYCEPGTKADTFAQEQDIPVKYTKVLKSTLDSKIDKTTITASSDGIITLADNTEFRVSDTVTSISFTIPDNIPNDFISSVVFKSGATATTISVTGTAKWCGDNITDNVFTPVANRVYNAIFYNDGFNIVGVVGGYSS